MKILLDTHAFLFAIANPAKLPPRLRSLLQDPLIERWVSVVSHWEIATKVSIGKLDMPSETSFYVRQIANLQAKTLPVNLRHSLGMHGLPTYHRNPFDRMLISQAMVENLTLASRDQHFQDYAVKCIWE
ncbi:MAG: type II toxin-antitoxin system VapC family toxin [Bryobacteraceae bacterium]|nr:type II toxin-antitoxin system VapC family toxin [Bryobacteraceae bacterium]